MTLTQEQADNIAADILLNASELLVEAHDEGTWQETRPYVLTLMRTVEALLRGEAVLIDKEPKPCD